MKKHNICRAATFTTLLLAILLSVGFGLGVCKGKSGGEFELTFDKSAGQQLLRVPCGSNVKFK